MSVSGPDGVKGTNSYSFWNKKTTTKSMQHGFQTLNIRQPKAVGSLEKGSTNNMSPTIAWKEFPAAL